MAITTDSYYDVIYNEETLDRIGLSKTLDNYTIEEIADYAFVGSYSQCCKQIMPRSLSNYTYVGYSELHGSCPFSASFRSGVYTKIDVDQGGTDDYNLTDNGLYRKVLLIHDISNAYGDNLTQSDFSNLKIITAFDAPKYTVDCGAKASMEFEDTNYWKPLSFATKYNTHLGAGDNVEINTCGFKAYVVIPYNNTYYIISANLVAMTLFEAGSINNSSYSVCANQIINYASNEYAGIAESVNNFFRDSDFTNAVELPYYLDLLPGQIFWERYDGYASRIYVQNYSFRQNFVFTEEYNLLLYLAGCYGLHFIVDGTVYKPIISNNFVVGYSDNLDVVSDLDNYVGSTKHDLPVTPPSPGPTPGPDDDDPWHGVDFGGTGAGGGGAFCSVYYMTGAELTSLKNWNMTDAPDNFDMLPSIIGLHQVPVALSGIPTTVKFLKSSAIVEEGEARLVDTGVSAGTGTGAPIDFSLGSVDINRRMQQRGEPYLDYDCTVELYLPFAGVFQLDTQAIMGRTISAKITLDPVNGTVFAYAWVENGGEKMPIAYGGGPIAVTLPISSNQWGLSRAAAQQMKHQQIQNVLNIAKDAVLSWAGGKMAQNINRMGFSTNVDAQIAQYGTTQGLKYQSVQQGSNIIESTANLVQGIHNLTQLNNTNYTAVNGSFGGSYAEWSQPFTAYVRITRPKFQKPTNYNHTQAVPCVEAKTVGSCTGLVQCINPDIDSIPCTQTEKVLIANALVNGVYAGGGGQ